MKKSVHTNYHSYCTQMIYPLWVSHMEENKREEDRKNFVRLGNKRVNNALKYIRLVGNLSNTSNYAYKEEDVQKIFVTLENAVTECRKRFDNKKKEKESFTLEE